MNDIIENRHQVNAAERENEEKSKITDKNKKEKAEKGLISEFGALHGGPNCNL